MKSIQYAVTLTVLIMGTVMDIRTRKIKRWLPAVYLISASVVYLIQIMMTGSGKSPENELQLTSLAAGLIPGACFLFLSFITGQAFGYGDSLLILGCGFSLGLTACLGVLMAALAGSALWGILQMIRKKADRKTEIPFVPFLLAGVLIFGTQVF